MRTAPVFYLSFEHLVLGLRGLDEVFLFREEKTSTIEPLIVRLRGRAILLKAILNSARMSILRL